MAHKCTFVLLLLSELFGDSVEQEVRWRHATDVGKLQGKTVRLRFVLKDADLYSFRFKD